MKKVIRGKLYDTDTAKAIGKKRWEKLEENFIWTEETLYFKRTGEYFIYGTSGAGGNYSMGDVIRPLPYKEALEWAEKYLTGEEYMEAFGEPAEDGESQSLYVWISARASAKLKAERSKTGETVAQVITRVLEAL